MGLHDELHVYRKRRVLYALIGGGIPRPDGPALPAPAHLPRRIRQEIRREQHPHHPARARPRDDVRPPRRSGRRQPPRVHRQRSCRSNSTGARSRPLRLCSASTRRTLPDASRAGRRILASRPSRFSATSTSRRSRPSKKCATRFPGVTYQIESKRFYPTAARASHLFGYTKEISEGQLAAVRGRI